MVQRLHLTVEIREKLDGSFEARCPELSLSARGRHAEEAIDRLKETVFSSLSDGFDASFEEAHYSETIEHILTQNPHCYLTIPRDPQAH